MLQTAKFPSLDYLSWTGRKMQNRGLIDGWTATGGINRSDFSSWILAGIFYFWMGFSEWLCLKAYQSFWMCGIDAISTHPGKNKEAKPVKKRLIISEPFHWCPSYRLPQSYPCQKKTAYLLKFTKGQASSFITLYQTRLVLVGDLVRVSGILGVVFTCDA